MFCLRPLIHIQYNLLKKSQYSGIVPLYLSKQIFLEPWQFVDYIILDAEELHDKPLSILT